MPNGCHDTNIVLSVVATPTWHALDSRLYSARVHGGPNVRTFVRRGRSCRSANGVPYISLVNVKACQSVHQDLFHQQSRILAGR